jgi:hypothetical protein
VNNDLIMTMLVYLFARIYMLSLLILSLLMYYTSSLLLPLPLLLPLRLRCLLCVC